MKRTRELDENVRASLLASVTVFVPAFASAVSNGFAASAARRQAETRRRWRMGFKGEARTLLRQGAKYLR